MDYEYIIFIIHEIIAISFRLVILVCFTIISINAAIYVSYAIGFIIVYLLNNIY